MMKSWEDYLIPGTNILKNKLGIINQEELTKKEAEIVIEKLTALIYAGGMNGNFDAKHLCAIHHFLFSDLYDFAGIYREVQIYKITSFLSPEKIPLELDKLLEFAKQKEVNTNSLYEIASFLANFYYELIRIHPFREGNGRTIREFLREFTSYKFPDYQLDLSKIDKKNFLIGVVDHDTYPSLLIYEIYNALTKVSKKALSK